MQRDYSLKKEIPTLKGIFILILVITFCAVLVLIINASPYVDKLWKENIVWKKYENDKINQLSAGVSLNVFYDALGKPVLEHEIRKGLKESSFKRKGYWVQTISDEAGEVLFYAVTICNSGFYPKIITPTAEEVILGKSKIRDIKSFDFDIEKRKFENENLIFTSDYHIYTSGLEYFYYFDGIYSGRSSRYQTLFIGLNDICLDCGDCKEMKEDLPELWYVGRKVDFVDEKNYKNDIAKKLKILNEFRDETPINTYGATAPNIIPNNVLPVDFRIGVERAKVRNLNN